MGWFAEIPPALYLAPLGLALAGLMAFAHSHRGVKALRSCNENELKRLTDEVQHLKSTSVMTKPEIASDQKSRFLATVSHELRTPLNGILGITDLLASTPLSPEQSSYLDAIRSSGASLASLIDEILDLSKIDARKLELVPAPFELLGLIESVVELLAPSAQGKGLEIACHVTAAPPRKLIGDAGRLRQILINLAGNAIKFTSSGGVGIRASWLSDGRLCFSVSDTGPGVPVAHRETIFEDFEQADSSATRQYEGTGLGLAISRRLVHLMGGYLRLEHTSSAGSVFAFAIKFGAAPGEVDEVVRKDLAGKRALVAAASPFGGLYLAERLIELGAKVIHARGEVDAIAHLQRESRDRLDFLLADCDLGEPVIERLSHAAQVAGVGKKLVLFSPFERRAFGDVIIPLFDGWLVKPVRVESLLARLASKPALQTGEKGIGPSSAFPQSLAGRHILLAEDNDVNALLVEKQLRRLGARVTRAEDGVEAVALARASIGCETPPFDAILMDIRMPRMDGLAAASKVRAEEARKGSVPIRMIAFSANAFDEDRRAAIAAGHDLFLTKPFGMEKLVEAILFVAE